jgi:hypothetical protein
LVPSIIQKLENNFPNVNPFKFLVFPRFFFAHDRGRSLPRLHKAHAEGKQDEASKGPRDPGFPLKPMQPNLKKVGPMKPFFRDPTRSGSKQTHPCFTGPKHTFFSTKEKMGEKQGSIDTAINIK